MIFSSNVFVFAADIKSLYPSLPIEWVLQQIKDLLKNSPTEIFLEISIDSFISILEWILKNNYFKFADKTYRQTDGIAMGTPCAVAIADLALSWHEYKNIPLEIW